MSARRRLARLLDGGLDDSWREPSRFGALGSVSRAALRRGTRPLVSRQQVVDDQVRRALDELAASQRLDALALAAPSTADVAALDTELGTVLFHAADEVMTPFVAEHGVWERDETRFLQDTLRPGHVFVDCGANVGWFSVLATRAVGATGLVVAVEPEARNLSLLRANLWRHAVSETIVLPMAAGAGRGLLELRVNEANRGDHQVHALGGGADARIVPIGALDEFLGDLTVDVVKVDVQGSDHDVVAGMMQTLRRSPTPVLLVEFWLTGMEERGVDPAAVLRRYRTDGFDVALLQPDGTPRTVTDAEVLDAARDAVSRYVNLVLRGGG